MTHIYGFVHKQTVCDIFKYTNSQHACIWNKHNYQIHIETTFNVETHLGETTKVLFIWNEKLVSTFCLCTQLVDSSLDVLYNSYRLLSSCALWFWVYVFLLFFSQLSICTQPGLILFLSISLLSQPLSKNIWCCF